ncbi:MAG: hypothetical protein ACXW1W_10520 [Methylococcaceae bacterium]
MFIRSFFCLGLLLVQPVLTNAQQAMEMYIPIGASVGVSNISSIIGKVATVDEQNKTFTVNDASGSFTIAVPDKTPVWLDRSKAGGDNQIGSVTDLKAELTVEVKYQEAVRAPALTAEWIKIEIPSR